MNNKNKKAVKITLFADINELEHFQHGGEDNELPGIGTQNIYDSLKHMQIYTLVRLGNHLMTQKESKAKGQAKYWKHVEENYRQEIKFINRLMNSLKIEYVELPNDLNDIQYVAAINQLYNCDPDCNHEQDETKTGHISCKHCHGYNIDYKMDVEDNKY